MKSHFETVSPLIDAYPAFLLDAYGVFWGGNHAGLLPGAEELMQTLISKGKIVGILSNSTQRAENEIHKYHTHGIMKNSHFHFLITSGEIARDIFLQEKLPFSTKRKSYYVLGGLHPHFPKALSLFDGTGYSRTEDLSAADFIYISIPHIDGRDVTDPELFTNQVQQVVSSKLPMVCASPDLFAHEGNPPQMAVRQGSLAKLYEKMGGEPYYIGKPHPNAYTHVFAEFSQRNIFKHSQILMIGDTPETDIRGGNLVGLDTALITHTGIFPERKSSNATLEKNDLPTYFIQRFCL